MTAVETMGFREFADHMRVKPGYITELKRNGRLVLTDDGKRVRVAESVRLIEDSRDPSKAGVTARHAEARGRATADLDSDDEQDDDSLDDEAFATSGPTASHAARRAKAAADREEAAARKALRDEQIELGTLLSLDEVVSAIRSAVTTLRAGLQGLPATLAPALAAAQSEDQTQMILSDAIEQGLEEISREFNLIAKGDGRAIPVKHSEAAR